MSEFQFYDTLIKGYSNLVPSEVEGLVIAWLYEKIQLEEIDRQFTYSDIQEAIRQTTISLNLESQPRTENIVTSLLHYFIESHNDTYERYALTEYAQKFLRLVEGKLNSPHKHFPLRKSFERYANFKAEDIKNIEDFESWFRQGFDDTTRQTILDHLEALQDSVRSALNELNQILFFENEQGALQMAHKFTATFNIFGEKADEIRDTLTLDFSLKQEIHNVVSTFYTQLESSYSATNNEAKISEYFNHKNAYHRAEGIQRKVNDFFKVVNEKLDRIGNQIVFASSKLNELQEHFKYQSRFKVNLRKMLSLLLEEGSYSKEELILPGAFPLKSMPCENIKFISVSRYSSFSKPSNTITDLFQDNRYRQQEKIKMEKVLSNQERVVEWVKHYQTVLQNKMFLDFNEHFYEIIEEEGNPSVALQVGFELFQFANREEQYFIDISKPLAAQLEKQKIVIWNMKIYQK